MITSLPTSPPTQDLADLNLKGASLREANLQHANLAFVDLSPTPPTQGANSPYDTIPRSADLIGAHLTGANLNGANLTEANLNGADLTEANLLLANLTQVNLTGVHFDEKTRWPAGFKPPPPKQ